MPYFIFLIDPLDPLGLLGHTSYGLGIFLQVVILSYQFVIQMTQLDRLLRLVIMLTLTARGILRVISP
jgi:hypothetical protein